jgi:hypothetical protein
MSDAVLSAIARQIAEVLMVISRERESPAGVQAKKELARLQWDVCVAWGKEKEEIAKSGALPEMSARFVRGDLVSKTDGDYWYEGRIAFSGYKLDTNALRYVVQDSRGLLLILNEKQLRGSNEDR